MLRLISCSFVWIGLVAAGCSSGSGAQVAVPVQPLRVSASFGAARADAPTTKQIVVPKPFTGPGYVTLASAATGPFAPASGSLPANAEIGLDFSFAVTLDPALASSANPEGTLLLHFESMSSSISNDVEVSLSGYLEQPDVQLVTTTLDFGPVAVGQNITRSVQIRNPTQTTPVNLTGVSALPAGFALDSRVVFPMTIAPSTSVNLQVSFHPDAVGARSTELDISTTATPELAATIRAVGIKGEVATDFGSVAVDANGETPWLDFDVIPQEVGFLIDAEGAPGSYIALVGLEGPDGEVYQNEQESGPYVWWRNFPYSYGYYGRMFVQFPNTDDPAQQPDHLAGHYRFRLYSTSPSPVVVRVWVQRRAGGTVVKGNLPIRLFIADGIPLSNPADPLADTKVHTILQTTDAILAQAGLRIGDVETRPLDASYDMIDADTDAGGAMFASQTAALPEDHVNVFLVNDITGGASGYRILGFSGGIPGPKENGTPYSGLVFAYDGQTGQEIGSTAAHELGHYLGLFHTVEQDGTHDLISDTALCPATGTNDACPIPGNNYLMNWLDLGPQGIVLTPGEARVILRHACVAPGVPAAPISSPATVDLSKLAEYLSSRSSSMEWCGTCQRLAEARLRAQLSGALGTTSLFQPSGR